MNDMFVQIWISYVLASCGMKLRNSENFFIHNLPGKIERKEPILDAGTT